MLRVERHGRHRYFRVAGREVAELIEALARLAPPSSVRSLRQGTRAQAVRFARTCYDHLAGMLGTRLMEGMLERGLLSGGDGTFSPRSQGNDRLAAPGLDFDYRLTPAGVDQLDAFGIDFAALRERRRPLVRYCVDWSEQRHHLAGSLGAAVADRMFELGWVRRAEHTRAVLVTDDGLAGIRNTFGVKLEASAG
jgi:hypothetical protein